MDVYIFVYFIAILLCFLKRYTLNRNLTVLFSLLLCVLCFLRAENIGSDTIHYLKIYQSDIAMSRYKKEFMFFHIIQWIKSVGFDEVGCQVAMAILCYIPFIILMYKKSCYPALTILLFIISTNRYFFETFNISRQMVAVSFALWSWIFFYEKKEKIAILFYVIACGFHMSTIFTLPVLLLCRKKDFSYKAIYCYLAISLFWTFIFSNPALISSFLYYLKAFSFLGIDKYVYLDGYRLEMDRTFVGLLTLVGPHVLLCILLVNKDRKNFLVKLYYCGVIMLNIVAVLPISYRFALSLTALELFLLPGLFIKGTYKPILTSEFFSKSKYLQLKNSPLLIFYIFLLLVYSLYLFTLSSSLAEYVPYKTF